VLTNTVKVRSEDEGISANDTDTTVVEVVTERVAAAVDGPIDVPVTVPTGSRFFNWLYWLIGLFA